MPLQVEFVAADRQVWQGEASSVKARTAEGEIGILPGHTPLLGVLVEGEVTIHGTGETKTVQVDGGFLSVHEDKVSIVVESVSTADSAPAASY